MPNAPYTWCRLPSTNLLTAVAGPFVPLPNMKLAAVALTMSAPAARGVRSEAVTAWASGPSSEPNTFWFWYRNGPATTTAITTTKPAKTTPAFSLPGTDSVFSVPRRQRTIAATRGPSNATVVSFVMTANEADNPAKTPYDQLRSGSASTA